MSLLLRHVRGLAIAVVALALSAGMAFAARGDAPPAAADAGLARAAEAAGMSVPVRADGTDADENETDADKPDETETPDAEETDAPEAEDPGDAADTDSHGALVSEAAKMDTPDGFANHGAFVSCVARMNHGHADGEASNEPVDLATLTPEDCGQTSVESKDGKTDAAGASTTHGKGHGKGKAAKGHGRGG